VETCTAHSLRTCQLQFLLCVCVCWYLRSNAYAASPCAPWDAISCYERNSNKWVCLIAAKYAKLQTAITAKVLNVTEVTLKAQYSLNCSHCADHCWRYFTSLVVRSMANPAWRSFPRVQAPALKCFDSLRMFTFHTRSVIAFIPGLRYFRIHS
jgi:hypothetical protein